MGNLAVETDILYPKDYVYSGFTDFSKETLGKPRVLSLLSTFLENYVERNERLLETSKDKDVITIFHGLRAPSLSIQQYIDRIFKYSCCSPSCFVIAQIYVDRFIQSADIYLTSLNIHRFLITSVMVAAKFMDDAFFNNTYYARVGGIGTSELNKLETKFLFGLDFRLYVSVHTFEKYCSVLKKEATVDHIERSIQSCGIKESWAKKEDSNRSESIAR